MPIISGFEEVLSNVEKYVTDCRKAEFKRFEIEFPNLTEFTNNECNNSTSQNAIYLQLVSKIYLLHDMVGLTDRLISKCIIKRMNEDDCNSFRDYFGEKDTKLLSNIILNLSDTSYVIVLSSLTYEILDNLIQSDTITKGFWHKTGSTSPVIVISNNVYQIQKNQLREKLSKITQGDCFNEKKTKNFETQLLQLLLAVTNVNKTNPVSQSYTFWIFKIDNIMLGVLVPRYETTKGSLINVWPIVPAATFYNPIKVINNLKIPNIDKSIFMSIAGNVKMSPKLNVINLRKEMSNGISLPILIQNRITVNNLYMSFFFEFLKEKQHFYFALPYNDTASYIKCRHCSLVYNSVFEFVRHWWTIKNKLVFRCHICDERVGNLARLGAHYRLKHCFQDSPHFQNISMKQNQHNSNSSHCTGISTQNEESCIPTSRQCPFCNTCKEGLHFMRMHLRNDHIEEIIRATLCRMKEKELIVNESMLENLWRNTYKFNNFDPGAITSTITPMPEIGRKYTRSQFQTLFNYNVHCPLCPFSVDYKYEDYISFLTHISRDHCSLKRFDCKSNHQSVSSSARTSFKVSEMDKPDEPVQNEQLSSISGIKEFVTCKHEKLNYSDLKPKEKCHKKVIDKKSNHNDNVDDNKGDNKRENKDAYKELVVKNKKNLPSHDPLEPLITDERFTMISDIMKRNINQSKETPEDISEKAISKSVNNNNILFQNQFSDQLSLSLNITETLRNITSKFGETSYLMKSLQCINIDEEVDYYNDNIFDNQCHVTDNEMENLSNDETLYDDENDDSDMTPIYDENNTKPSQNDTINNNLDVTLCSPY